MNEMVDMPDIYMCEVVDNERLNDTAVAVTILCGGLADKVLPGQFLHIKCGDSLILRRPFGVCSVLGDALVVVFEVKGKGTNWLSRREPGDILDILGPLGNGFFLPAGRIIVVGGGLGSPPMLFTAESAKAGVTAVLGFREKSRVMLVSEFEDVCDAVYLATDDGSAGICGPVTKPLEKLLERGGYDAVLSCGQLAMQQSVAKLCMQFHTPCQVSLEERMGCGVGACLVCACATRKDGADYMSRVCADGPVFYASDVIWQ